jgi:hypothetical protein
MGQRSGATSLAANWVPQVIQMKFVITYFPSLIPYDFDFRPVSKAGFGQSIYYSR